jgi:pimeloyl-ACP methyl ester carboxylesterase
MGGYAGLAFGELFPDNLRGFVMFHSSSYQDSPEKKTDRDRSILAIKKRRKSFLNIVTTDLFFHKKDPHLKKVKEITSATTARALVAATEGMKDRKDREIILRFSEYPVLFIYGKHDKILNWEKMAPQTEIPRDRETVLLENAGHIGFYEAKEECLNAIIRFANRCFRLPVE